MRGKNYLFLGLVIVGLLIIPSVMAIEWDFFFGNTGVDEFFQNEWILFAIVFGAIFAALYYIIRDRTDNVPISVIVGGGISLLITIPLFRRGIINSIVGEATGEFLTLSVFVIGLLVVLYWLFKKFKFKGVLTALGLVFLIPVFFDLNEMLPEQIMLGAFGDYVQVVEGIGNLVVTAYLLLLGVMFVWWVKKKHSLGSGDRVARRGQRRQRGRDRRARRLRRRRQRGRGSRLGGAGGWRTKERLV